MDPTGLGVATMQTSGKCCESQKLKAYVRRKPTFGAYIAPYRFMCNCVRVEVM